MLQVRKKHKPPGSKTAPACWLVPDFSPTHWHFWILVALEWSTLELQEHGNHCDAHATVQISLKELT